MLHFKTLREYFYNFLRSLFLSVRFILCQLLNNLRLDLVLRVDWGSESEWLRLIKNVIKYSLIQLYFNILWINSFQLHVSVSLEPSSSWTQEYRLLQHWYIYIYSGVYIYIYIHTHTHTHIYTRTLSSIYIYQYQCCKRQYYCVQPEEGSEEAETRSWKLLYIYIYTHSWVWYIYIYIYIYIHSWVWYIYIYILITGNLMPRIRSKLGA